MIQATINYRTSRQIFAWSLGVANQKAADLDEGADSMSALGPFS